MHTTLTALKCMRHCLQSQQGEYTGSRQQHRAQTRTCLVLPDSASLSRGWLQPQSPKTGLLWLCWAGCAMPCPASTASACLMVSRSSQAGSSSPCMRRCSLGLVSTLLKSSFRRRWVKELGGSPSNSKTYCYWSMPDLPLVVSFCSFIHWTAVVGHLLGWECFSDTAEEKQQIAMQQPLPQHC